MAAETDISRIFAAQLELQRQSYGVDPSSMEGSARADYIRTMAYAAIDEIGEALDETSWKPWSSDEGEVHSRDAFVSELVDAFFFVMNLAAVVGCDGEEFAEKYWAKHEKNRARQEAGYASRTGKCPMCYRALDDAGVDCRDGYCAAVR